MFTRSFGATEPSLAISLSLVSVTTLNSPDNSSRPEAQDGRRVQAAEPIVYHAGRVLLHTPLGRVLGGEAQHLQQPLQAARGQLGVPALQPALRDLAIQVFVDRARQHRLAGARRQLRHLEA